MWCGSLWVWCGSLWVWCGGSRTITIEKHAVVIMKPHNIPCSNYSIVETVLEDCI